MIAADDRNAPREADRLFGQGRFKEALEIYRDLLPEGDPDRGTASLVYKMGHCCLHLGRYDEAGSFLLAARRLDRDGAERFNVTVSMANLMVRTGKYRDAAALVEELLGRGSPPLPREASVLHYTLGQAYFYLGEYRLAIKHGQKALKAYRELENERGAMATLQNLAAAHHQIHELSEAIGYYDEVCALAESLEDVRTLPLALLNLGSLHADRCDYLKALELFEAAERLLEPLASPPHESALKANRASLLLRLGDFERAEEELAGADELARREGLAYYRGYNSLVRGEILRERGRFEEAEKSYLGAAGIFGEIKATRELFDVRLGMAALYRRWGRIAEGREELEKARRVEEAAGSPYHSALLAIESALLSALKNMEDGPDPEALRRAGAEAEEALSFFGSRDYPEPLWCGYYAGGLARQLAGDVAGAQRHYIRAYDILDTILRGVPEERREGFLSAPKVADFLARCREVNLDRSNHSLLKILSVNRALSEGFDAEDVERCLGRIVDEALALTHAERGFVLIEGRRTVGRSSRGEELDEENGPPAEALRRARTAGETILAVAGREGSAEDRELLERLGLVALAAAPVRIKGESVGLLYLDGRRHRGAFRPEALYLLEALAEQAGLAAGHARLYERLRRAEASLLEEVSYLRERLGEGEGEIVGRSPVFMEAVSQARRIAPENTTVLLRGESGTGKELLAQLIHDESRRGGGAFVKLNVTAIPEGLLESELFGHLKGSFTGAAEDRPGKFLLAHGGTILLDEIGELPLSAQVKLLRFLEEREVRPVGGVRARKVDARVVASTNRDLEAAIASGAFREDLFYRLNVFPIVLPPLRERREDVPLLARFFIERYCRRFGKRFEGLDPASLRRLLSYPWPGNVRELENVIQRAVLLGKGPLLTVGPLGNDEGDAARAPDPGLGLRANLDIFTGEVIRSALKASGGNKKQAAQLLEISRSRLYELLDSLGLKDTV